MKPVRLELNFVRRQARPAAASWLLLAIALAFVGDVALNYAKMQSELEAKQARLAALPRARPAKDAMVPVSLVPISDEELAAARDTILHLSTPWDNIFKALESSKSDDIALLSIEPTVESGALTLTGEAKDYLAALTYVSWLQKEKSLRDVHLTKHELRQNDPQRPVFFTISANWKADR